MFICVCAPKFVSILVLATDTRSAPAFGFHLFCSGSDADLFSPKRDSLDEGGLNSMAHISLRSDICTGKHLSWNND